MDELLEVGVTNDDVLDVQDRLRFLHLYQGPIDGSFTSFVSEAVMAFQQHVGVEATGTLDVHGLPYLRQYADQHGYGHHDQHAHESHPDGHGHGHGHVGPDEWAMTQ